MRVSPRLPARSVPRLSAVRTAALGPPDTYDPFFPAGHASVVRNWDFRNGLPSGWTQVGTGHTYDSRGFHSATGGLTFDGTAISASMESQGTIIIEVERAAIAFNGPKSAATFIDYVGHSDTASATRYIGGTRETAGFTKERRLYVNQTSTASTFVWLDDFGGTTTVDRITNHVPLWLDPVYATLIITWTGGNEYLIVDGTPIKSVASTASADRLQFFYLACSGSANSYLGDYGIRRVQLLSTHVAPTTSTKKGALIGDSFWQRSTERASHAAEPNAPSQAQIEAVQVDDTLNASRAARFNFSWGNGNWGHQLQGLAYLHKRRRQYLRLFNAGDSGNGWRSDLGANHQFSSGLRSAVVAYDPEFIIAAGSVNDINIGDTAHALNTDILNWLTALIEASTSLRTVLWFHTFGTPDAIRTDSSDRVNYTAELQAQLAAFNSLSLQLNNASGQPVVCRFIPTWQAWARAGTQVPEYAIGTHPNNALASKVSASVSGDVHPSGEGSKRIAEIIWPYLRGLL